MKIRGNHLYIGRKLHGKGDRSTFTKHPTLTGTLNSSTRSVLSHGICKNNSVSAENRVVNCPNDPDI